MKARKLIFVGVTGAEISTSWFYSTAFDNFLMLQCTFIVIKSYWRRMYLCSPLHDSWAGVLEVWNVDTIWKAVSGLIPSVAYPSLCHSLMISVENSI